MLPTQARAYIKLRSRRRLLERRLWFIAAYFCNPDGFAKDCILWPIDPQTGERESLAPFQSEALTDFEKHRHYSLDAGRGGGKTMVLALIVIWFAITREVAGFQWKALTTSGSWSQLEKFLWPEIHLWIGRLDWSRIPLDPFRKDQLQTQSLNLDHGLAYSKAASDPNLMEGAHAKHMLIVGDEAKMLSMAKLLSIQGSLSTGEGWEILSSIQGASSSAFNQIQQGKVPGYRVRHVTKEELIASGRMKAEWADLMLARTGENSDFYRNHVLSLPSLAGGDQMIQLAWIEAAFKRHRDWVAAGGKLEYITAIGSDISSGGGDQAFNAIRQGDVLAEINLSSDNTMTSLGEVVSRLRVNPSASCVYDSVNQGVAWRDRGAELEGLNLIPFNGGHKTEARDAATGLRQYADKRSWLLDHLAWLLNPASGSQIALPEWKQEGHTSLADQALQLKMETLSNGRLKVESKRAMRRRLNESTDVLDAVAYAYNPEADGVFKRHHWRFWQHAEMRMEPVDILGADGQLMRIESVSLPEMFIAMIQSWHTSYREDDAMRQAQFAVGQVQAYTTNECFIVDQVRQRMDFPQACAAMNDMGRKWPGAAIRVLDFDSNGDRVIASMRCQVPGIHGLRRDEGSLVSDATAVAAEQFAGGIYLPHPQLAPWVTAFIQEGAEFPSGANKEQISALCLGFGAVRNLAALGESRIMSWGE